MRLLEQPFPPVVKTAVNGGRTRAYRRSAEEHAEVVLGTVRQEYPEFGKGSAAVETVPTSVRSELQRPIEHTV